MADDTPDDSAAAEPGESGPAAAETQPPRGRRPRTGWRRFVPRLRTVLLVVVLVAVGAAAALAIAVMVVPVPQASDIARAQVTTFYWDDGKTVMGRMGEANRVNVTLAQVSPAMRSAVLAAEDRDFYAHQGFSPTGLVRAVWNNINGGSTQGGSTITQQYAKNAFLTQDRTYWRKLKELVLSIKIETQVSKDEILADYLNTVYYGRGAYGIEAAAQTYFGVSASELNPSQAAMLAGLLQAPSALDPAKNPSGLQKRWNYVLDGMVDMGAITAAQRATMTFPDVRPYQPPVNYYEGTNGYLFTAAQQQMYALGYSEDDLNIEGLQVTTTFNIAAEEAAIKAVEDYGPTTGTDGLRIGLASVVPQTGAVVAIYGGSDFQASQYNNATQARGQAGSTFKPFGLAAGLGNGIGLDTRYNGSSPMKIQGYEIENYGDASYGSVTMLYATEQSINTPYVQMNSKIGGDKTRASLVAAGIPAETPGLDDQITNVLGAASPTPLEVAGAYGTLANRGVQTPTSTVQLVRSASGSVLWSLTPQATVAYTNLVADRVTYALRQVVLNGTGTAAQSVGRPVAGKTGTSDDNMSAWFSGYAPQLATSVMMVKNDASGANVSLAGTGGMRSVTGGSFPARIWSAYMEAALDGQPEEDFVDPERIYDSRSPSAVPSRTRSQTSSPRPSSSFASPSSTSATPTQSSTTSAPPTPTLSGASPSP